MTLSEFIKQYREEHKMSMDDFAKISGLSKPYISMLEKNRNSRNGKKITPSIRTYAKIAEGVGMSLNAFMEMMNGEDHVRLGDDTTTPSQNIVKGIRIPILGRVVAGIPLEAIEDIEGWEEITPRMASGGEFFALRIRGSSMEPKLVEGDVVIVRKQSTVDNGDVAIVLVNGNEATCKQVNRTPAGITLIGFNIAVYAPHFYTNDQIESLPVTIVGKVVESRHTW